MSKKFKFELNRAGVRELMKSQEMGAILEKHARATASAAGEGYEINTGESSSRKGVGVITATPEAIQDNYDNNTLLKSLR